MHRASPVVARKVRRMVHQAGAAATRAQIVRGAAERFDMSGFEGASLGEITEAAGMTKGALYFHFRSKEELARHIIAEQHRISISAVQAIAAQDASAIEQIVMLCHEMARQIVQDPIVRVVDPGQRSGQQLQLHSPALELGGEGHQLGGVAGEAFELVHGQDHRLVRRGGLDLVGEGECLLQLGADLDAGADLLLLHPG